MFSCLGQNPLYCLQWQGLAGGGGGLEHGGLLKHESDMVATPGACAHSGRSPGAGGGEDEEVLVKVLQSFICAR